jgi:hypothetical protein
MLTRSSATHALREGGDFLINNGRQAMTYV